MLIETRRLRNKDFVLRHMYGALEWRQSFLMIKEQPFNFPNYVLFRTVHQFHEENAGFSLSEKGSKARQYPVLKYDRFNVLPPYTCET